MLDAYQPCPCGNGKKVKFCCSKDIASEIDKITSSIRSDQRVAAMEQLNRLIESKGERDCLLVLKIAMLIQLGRIDPARELIDRMLEANPENPLVLANAAGVALHDRDVDQAVVLLQNALDAAEESIPTALLRSFKLVGIALLMSGRYNAGRVHLGLYSSWLEEPDEEVVGLLMQAYAARQVPMLLREDLEIRPPTEDVEWYSEWPEIAELVNRMRFRSAIERLREAEARFPKDHFLRRNIAILESRLGDNEATADAWRAYSVTEGVPLHEAIEAEAIAQLLDEDQDRDFLEQQQLTFWLTDSGDASEKMLADPRFDLARAGYRDRPEEGPPPKAVFHWLSRTIPDEDAELSLDTIPEILADVFVYGKETDQEARVVIDIVADEQLEERLAEFRSTLGDAMGDSAGEPKVMERFTRQSSLLGWRWRMPAHATAEDQERVAVEKHRQVLHETWPDLALDVLDGKTPKQAANDEEYLIRLHAAILILEQSGDEQLLEQIEINELRKSLGLETRDTIDPEEDVDINTLSLSRFSRVEFGKLDDDRLLFAMERAALHGLLLPSVTIMTEVLARESIGPDKYDEVGLRVQLSRLVTDRDRAIELIQEAQQMVVQQGHSPAGLLINEIDLRLSRGIVDGLQELVQRIDSQYIREPGVANALAAVLQKYGLLDPSTVAAQPGAPTAAASARSSAPVQSEIWTPDADANRSSDSDSAPTPPSQDEGPSKLWLPGMD